MSLTAIEPANSSRVWKSAQPWATGIGDQAVACRLVGRGFGASLAYMMRRDQVQRLEVCLRGANWLTGLHEQSLYSLGVCKGVGRPMTECVVQHGTTFSNHNLTAEQFVKEVILKQDPRILQALLSQPSFLACSGAHFHAAPVGALHSRRYHGLLSADILDNSA